MAKQPAKYTYAQLMGLWIKNGGSKALAPVMAAIAMAESGGDPNAYNPQTCGGGSHAEGLWQICMPMNAKYVPGGSAYVPAANAQAAVQIEKVHGKGAWST